jgi:hypothetical protein
MSFPSVWDVVSGFSVNCEAKQPPRPASAEPEARLRRLLFSEVRVPRLDPAPRRKRGAGFKTRLEEGGFRWSPSARAASSQVVAAFLYSVLP